MYTLSFTENELNTIINSIGQRAYVEVFQLIAKIQSSFLEQQKSNSEEDIKKYEFDFSESELNVVINSIGQRPYIEVVSLISNIQNQITESNQELELTE